MPCCALQNIYPNCKLLWSAVGEFTGKLCLKNSKLFLGCLSCLGLFAKPTSIISNDPLLPRNILLQFVIVSAFCRQLCLPLSLCLAAAAFLVLQLSAFFLFLLPLLFCFLLRC